MNFDSLIVQQPEGQPSQLVLLMHGVGSEPRSMMDVGSWFAKRDPQSYIVSIASPEPSDIAPGRQWFSVRGVTEANRQERVDAALPGFVLTVQQWQKQSGVDAAHTLIVGFSQGAIMALESTKLAASPAARVVAMGGRYATLPQQRPAADIHLLHGSEDAVMPVALGQAAYARLQQLGARASLNVVLGVGHVPHSALLSLLAPDLPAPLTA